LERARLTSEKKAGKKQNAKRKKQAEKIKKNIK